MRSTSFENFELSMEQAMQVEGGNFWSRAYALAEKAGVIAAVLQAADDFAEGFAEGRAGCGCN